MLRVQIKKVKDYPIDAHFNCAKGQLHALVGPSGSGKTTILRIIAGLTNAKGQIRYQEDDWLDTEKKINLKTQDRSIGFLFQQYALFPHLTILENICIPQIARSKKNIAHAIDCLSEIGLLDYVHRYPSELSGGQQQRVALARAIVTNPKVLLLDEPFSAVDAPTRQNLYLALAEFRKKTAIPIILVTHNLNEAAQLADHITVIDEGRSIQTSTPTDLFDKPRNARVAELVGSPNLYSGRFDQGLLQWGENSLVLKVKDKGRIKKPTDVAWMIPSHSIEILDAQKYPSPLKSNIINCTVIKIRQLGQIAVVEWAVNQTKDSIIWQASIQELKRLNICEGATKQIHLDAEHIHIMPKHTHHQA